jgi:hypothetical protein
VCSSVGHFRPHPLRIALELCRYLGNLDVVESRRKFTSLVEIGIGIDLDLLRFNVIKDSLKCILILLDWCPKVIVHIMLPSKSKMFFLQLIASLFQAR